MPRASRRSRKSAEQLLPRVQLSRAELVALVRARQNTGIGVIRFSRMIGVSPSAFDNYESGLRRPPVDVLGRWRAALMHAALIDAARHAA